MKLTQGLIPILTGYFLSSKQYPGTFFSFAYNLLMISPPYGEDAPKALTTLISGVTIFYRLIVMPDIARPTFLNAVNLLTSLDNLGINLIFGSPTKLNHTHIRHLTTHLTRETGVGPPGGRGGTCSAVAVTLRVQMNSARWHGDNVSSHSVGRWRHDGHSIPFKV